MSKQMEVVIQNLEDRMDLGAKARRLMKAKRFTDAELAAEWHFALAEAETWFWVNHEQGDDRLEEQAAIMHRFATLPHYDEAAA